MFFGGSQTRFFLCFQILASDVFRSALAEIEFIKLELQIEFLKPEIYVAEIATSSSLKLPHLEPKLSF